MRWAGLGAALCAVAASTSSAQTVRVLLRWRDVPDAHGYEVQIARDAAFTDVVVSEKTSTPSYRWEQAPTTAHWWRVRSFDAENRPSEWSQARTVAVQTVVPLPKEPQDKATVTCGEPLAFELEPSPLLAEYVVTLSASPDFARARELDGKTPLLGAERLAPGRWYWRARGVDVRGRTSEESPARSFTVKLSTPRPLPTPDLLPGGDATLAWADVPCATGYRVEASADRAEKVTLTAKQSPVSLPAPRPVEIRWRVVAVADDGVESDASSEAVLRVRLPMPREPQETAGPPPELTWSASPGATGYRVEVAAPGQDFTPPLVATTVTALKHRLGALAQGSYRWRVAAVDGAGHSSVFTEPRPLVLGGGRDELAAVKVTAPAEGEVVPEHAPVQLEWSLAAGASGYEVELDGSLLAGPGPVEPKVQLPPLAAGPHRLRVRAVGGPWSDARALTVGTAAIARASVEQTGLEVRVDLLDREGRPVSTPPALAVRSGRLSTPSPRGTGWVAKWEPPATGADVLVVSAADFRLERELVAKTAPLAVAAYGGAVLNGGAVASPTATVALEWRLPVLERRLTAAARVGLYRAGARIPVGGESLDASVWLVPVSAVVEWRQRLGAFWLRGGAGPALQLAFSSLGLDRRADARVGLELLLAAGRALGPGVVELEVGYLFGRLDTSLVKLNAGGVGLRLGYVLDLPP